MKKILPLLYTLLSILFSTMLPAYALKSNAGRGNDPSGGTEMSNYNPIQAAVTGERLYVKKGATGTGSSWTDALGELSTALGQARVNTAIAEIWVAGGTYLPSQQWNILTNEPITDEPRRATFILSDHIKLYGGFKGTESNLSERNIKDNPTILSGDLHGDLSQLAFHVVVMINVGSHTVLDGFTIQKGQADRYGAGMYLKNAHPHLSNLIIRDNEANNEGGGIYMSSSNPTCSQIQILNNTSKQLAGALRIVGSNPIFTHLKVIGNKITSTDTYSYGAAIYSSKSKPIFINALFTNNESLFASFYYGHNGDTPTFINTIAIKNGDNNISLQASEDRIRFYNSIVLGKNTVRKERVEAINSMVEGHTDAGANGNISAKYINPLWVFESLDEQEPGYLRPKLNGIMSNTGTADLQVITDFDGIVVPMPDTDLAGNSRVSEGRIDIGPFENPNVSPPLLRSIYVKQGSHGKGTSWTDSMGELADALIYAQENHQHWQSGNPLKIYVARGTYKPRYSPRDGAAFADENVSNTFLMVKNVQLFGGFDPDQGITDLTHQRIFDLIKGTILSGDLNGDDQIEGAGKDLKITNTYDNAYHTVLSVGEVETALLDGFTITGGIGRNMYQTMEVFGKAVPYMDGGGVYGVDNSSPGLRNLIFMGNWGYHGGGLSGVYTPVIENVMFIKNIGALGGGLWSGSNFTIRNAAFIGNRGGNGGAMGFNNNAEVVNPVIENATFVGNYANESGGAIYNLKNAQIKLKNSVIMGNHSGIFNSPGTSTQVQSSLVQGLSNTDEGNLDATNVLPENVFIDMDKGNYRLKHGSPAIDRGSNNLYSGNLSDDKDVSGFQRQVGSAIDMGAYEYGLPPVIDKLDGDVFSYIQGDSPMALDQNEGARVSDPDSPDMDGGNLRVQVVSGVPVEDVIAIRNAGVGAGQIGTNGTAVSYEGMVMGQFEGGTNGQDLVIYFNKNATLQRISALISHVTYSNTQEFPVITQRIIGLTLEDGDGGYSETSIVKGNILKFTNALTLIVSTGATVYTTNAGPVPIDPLLILTGPAQTSISSATVSIGSGFEADDVLSFTSDGNLTGIYNGATGVLSITGTADMGIWQTALQSVRFKSSNWVPNLAPRTVTFTVTDNTTTRTEAKVVAMIYDPMVAADGQNILYVNKNVSGGNRTGTSWAHAIPELGSALKWAHENRGNQMWSETNPLKIYVAKGMYKPMFSPTDDNFGVEAGRGNTFLLVKDVQLFGGFDPEQGITDGTHARILTEVGGAILSGDFNGDDVYLGAGESLTFTNYNENAYNVVVGADVLGVARLDGFTIQSGNADVSETKLVNGRYINYNHGGGVQITYGSPTLANLHVKACKSTRYGGGIFTGTSSAILNDINVHHNQASEGGGIGLLYAPGVPLVNNLTVRYNKADWGGGMTGVGGGAKINNALISDNWSSVVAGGIDNWGSAKPVFTNSIIANNTNGGSTSGGAIRMYDRNSSVTLINSLVIGNKGGGAVLDNVEGTFKIYNSIVIGNEFGVKGAYDIKHSIVQGKAADLANGNPDGNVNPGDIFTDYINGDYTLKTSTSARTLATNPAINAGNNSLYDAALYGANDAYGVARIRDGFIDLGAFEVQQGDNPLPLRLISFSGNVETGLVTLAWQTAEELNTSHFDIQRSTDARNFSNIGQVEAGNVGNHSYTFPDIENPLLGTSYYRLKMVDMDGSFSYSRMIGIEGKATEDLSLYPNPLAVHKSLILQSSTATEASLYDMTGRLCYQFSIQAGNNTISLPKLTPGMYLIRTTNGQRQKLVVQ